MDTKKSVALEAYSISKIFNAGKSNEVRPVESVSLSVAQNTCVLIQGASGSGKTTLLSILSCLAKPSAGRYECLGEPVSRWSEKFLTRFRRQHLGIVFQRFQLVEYLSAYQNIALPLLPRALSDRAIDAKVRQVASQLGLTARLHFRAGLLSGGEQQRVAIARALVHEPRILFADEPTAHLDGRASAAVLEIFAQIKAEGRTLVITSHDARVAQSGLIDTVLTMEDGHLQ
ncbi:MAG: ABC transporter ATP-binding protein [Microscillaceae bacterium]|nr:ABC transporter ATP-binding protein [Microscillaceae bacterium]